MQDKKLQVVPLGGLGEFGMHMMAIRYGDDIIVRKRRVTMLLS